MKTGGLGTRSEGCASNQHTQRQGHFDRWLLSNVETLNDRYVLNFLQSPLLLFLKQKKG